MTVAQPDRCRQLPTQRAPSRAWRKLKANKGALAGFAIVVFFTLLAVARAAAADSRSQCDRLVGDPQGAVRRCIGLAPTIIGRDILSRMIWGAQASLLAGVISVAIAVVIGVPFGLASPAISAAGST